MSFPRTNKASIAVACVALLTGVLSASALWAHGGSHGSGTRNTPSAQAPQPSSSRQPSPDDLNLDARSFQPPHGGQIAATKWHFFEVVYGPQETRLYVYSPSKRPLYAPSVKGHLVMQVDGNPQEFRYPLKPVVDDSKLGKDMGYLMAAVDVTRVRDGDMQVTFELTLSSREEPEARFSQTFALSRSPVQVPVAQLTEADRPLIARQRVCPVMEGTELGAHGTPIKLMVGNQPLFVCCEGCVDEVRKNPRQHLQKVSATRTNQPPRRSRPAVYWASRSDEAAVRAQGICPVMNQPLGAHGRVIKLVIDDRPIFVCCDGCIEKVVAEPSEYFRKASEYAARQSATSRPTQVSHRQHVEVGYATAADRPAVEAQGACPVMNQPLGSHGTPIKVTFGERSVFVCCEGCVDRVRDNFALYFGLANRRQQPTAATGGSCCSGNSSKKRSCCQ